VAQQVKGKGVPSSINEGRVPGGDPAPEPSPPQVAFSRAGAIQRLGGGLSVGPAVIFTEY